MREIPLTQSHCRETVKWSWDLMGFIFFRIPRSVKGCRVYLKPSKHCLPDSVSEGEDA